MPNDLIQSEETWFNKGIGSFLLTCGLCGKEFDLLNSPDNKAILEHAKEHGSTMIGVRGN